MLAVCDHFRVPFTIYRSHKTPSAPSHWSMPSITTTRPEAANLPDRPDHGYSTLEAYPIHGHPNTGQQTIAGHFGRELSENHIWAPFTINSSKTGTAVKANFVTIMRCSAALHCSEPSSAAPLLLMYSSSYTTAVSEGRDVGPFVHRKLFFHSLTTHT